MEKRSDEGAGTGEGQVETTISKITWSYQCLKRDEASRRKFWSSFSGRSVKGQDESGAMGEWGA